MNHGCFPSHLYKIGIIDSPLCPHDNEVADLDHVFFGCVGFSSNELVDGLIKVGVQFPTCIKVLLATGNDFVYDLLFNHITKNNISI